MRILKDWVTGSSEIMLNLDDKDIIKKAIQICEVGSELSTKINKIEEIDDSQHNNFEWARIYLNDILEEVNHRKNQK